MQASLRNYLSRDDAIDGRGLIHKHVTSHVGKFERSALCLFDMQAGQPRTQMASCFVNPKHKHKGLRPACLALAGLVLLISAGDDAVAASGRSRRLVQSVESRCGGDPIMAIVSLPDQRITVYDADGWILRAGVSSS